LKDLLRAEGEGETIPGDKMIPIKAGMAIYIPPYVIHGRGIRLRLLGSRLLSLSSRDVQIREAAEKE